MIELSDGAVLWTSSRLRPGAPAVVLLHGGPGMWDYLAPVADLLDGFSTYRYDQRGCGRSSAVGEYRLDRYLADLEELRRHHGHDRWAVFGHSFGANLALAYAAAYPDSVAAVVYCDGVGLDWPRHRAAFHTEAQKRLSASQKAQLEALESLPRTWEQEVQWRTLNWLPDFAPGPSAELLAFEAASTQLPLNMDCNRELWPQLSARGLAAELAECAAVSAPVLAIHGDADPRPLAPVVALVEALSRGHLTVVKDAGHQPWLEQPEAFGAALTRFLT